MVVGQKEDTNIGFEVEETREAMEKEESRATGELCRCGRNERERLNFGAIWVISGGEGEFHWNTSTDGRFGLCSTAKRERERERKRERDQNLDNNCHGTEI